MVFNTDTALMVQESIVSLSKEKITNVRKYKYLLNTLTQITTCHSFMKELVLPSKNGMNWSTFFLTSEYNSVKFLTTCLRSRLFYSIQAWRLSEGELKKVICHGFLRKMVRGGFERNNPPNRMSSSNTCTHSANETTLDWSYMLSNERHNITHFKLIMFMHRLTYWMDMNVLVIWPLFFSLVTLWLLG